MDNILNLVNVKTSTETYGSFSDNYYSDTFFIKHEHLLEMFRLIRINGVVFMVVGVSHSDVFNMFEYKIRLYYDTI